MLIVIGTVIQDVVADAMSTEVVSRVDAAGNARPEDDIRAELGMVQVLGRLALVALEFLRWQDYPDGSPAFFARETVFLLGLVVPAISALGVLLIRSEAERAAADRLAHPRRRHRLWCGRPCARARRLPFGQEFIFVLSMRSFARCWSS